MNKSHSSDQEERRPSANMAVPLDVQVRLAESKRKLAIVRYKLGVRRGGAWFKVTKETPIMR